LLILLKTKSTISGKILDINLERMIPMFDKGYFEGLVKTIKAEHRQRIKNMIDFALDTEDREWFDQLIIQLRRTQ
jgi:hypothetical protein